MQTSAIRASVLTPQTFVANHVWDAVPRPLIVQVAEGVVNGLTEKAMEALKSVPRRGLEIGGLLLGRREVSDGVTTIWIEGFHAIESEHRNGPAYLLSESDFARMDEAREQFRESALGIYRTQTRSESMQLRDLDLQLYQRYFGDQGLFLLIRPPAKRAALFLPEAGALQSAHEFSFQPARTPNANPLAQDRASVAPIPHRHRERPKPVASSATATPGNETKMPETKQASEFAKYLALSNASWRRLKSSWPLGWQPVIMALGALGLAGTLIAIRHARTPAAHAAVSPAQVHLYTQTDVRSVKLFWDRNAAAIKDASRAVLHIHDGTKEKSLSLLPRDLSAGNVIYAPDARDVTFRLEIFSAGKKTTESIAVVTMPSRAAPIPAPVAPGPTAARKITEQPGPHPVSPRFIEKAPQNKRTNSQEPGTSATPVVPPESEPASSPVSTTVSRAVPPDPPRFAAAALDTSAHVPDHELSVSVEAEPVESWYRKTVGKVPLLRRLGKSSDFVPPRPKREVRPSLSAEDKRSVPHPVFVDVKVHVGESGKVESVALRADADSRSALSSAAVHAANEWEFEPARVDGEAVPADVILHFRFRPNEAALQ